MSTRYADDATLARIAELEAENAALARDAARYRWLKGAGRTMSVDWIDGEYRVVDTAVNLVVTDWMDSFDAAIDEAMKEPK